MHNILHILGSIFLAVVLGIGIPLLGMGLLP